MKHVLVILAVVAIAAAAFMLLRPSVARAEIGRPAAPPVLPPEIAKPVALVQKKVNTALKRLPFGNKG